MKNKNIWIIAVIIIIIVVIYIINNPQKEETIKIGGAFGLTGFSSTWGEADKNGALLVIEETNNRGGINGKKVELIVEDIKSDNKEAVSAILKLIEVDKTNLIIGPTWMDTFLGPAPISDEKNILMISPSAAITAVQSEKNYKNIFSTWYRSDSELKLLPSYLAKEKIKNVVIIISNDIFWMDAVKNIKETANKSGIKILEEYKVNPQDSDLRTPITKIKNLKPDAIFFGFNSEENLAGFLKQRKEIFPNSKLITTESIEEFTNKKNFKELLTNVKFIAPKVLESDFNSKYKKRFNLDPVYSASNSYDATKIVLEAIEKTKSTDTDKIREYIMTHEFNTVTFGKTKFDNIGGVIGGKFIIKSVENGSIRLIEEIN